MNEINISTKIKTDHGILNLSFPVMNASGIFCYPPVLRLVTFSLGTVVTKSIGSVSREGFKEPIVAYNHQVGLVNAVGLANTKEIKQE